MTFLQHVNLERSDSLSTRNISNRELLSSCKGIPNPTTNSNIFQEKNAFIHYTGDWNRQSHHHLSFDVFFYVLIHIHTKLLLSIRPNKMPAWVKPTARPSIVQIHLNSEIKKNSKFWIRASWASHIPSDAPAVKGNTHGTCYQMMPWLVQRTCRSDQWQCTWIDAPGSNCRRTWRSHLTSMRMLPNHEKPAWSPPSRDA